MVMTLTGVANPIEVGEGEIEAPLPEPIVEVVKVVEVVEAVESEPTHIIETEQVVEEENKEEATPIIFMVTAYCPCEMCCDKSDGITATGVTAIQGRTIAVDPNYIPYGTEITINGNTYVAEDCGGAIKGNRIDIYFDSHQEAVEFGVQYLEGVIL